MRWPLQRMRVSVCLPVRAAFAQRHALMYRGLYDDWTSLTISTHSSPPPFSYSQVKDKAQVRSTGPINNLTRQPVKGRKKGGGIRFGEMERDSLLAHGASFLLHDRLHNCSDRHIALVCKKCGSMVAPHGVPASATMISGPPGSWSGAPKASAASNPAGITTSYHNIGGSSDAAAGRVNRGRRNVLCRACGDGDAVVPVAMPYVFRYLVNELAGMNIKVQLEMGEGPYGDQAVTEAVRN